MDEGRKGGVGGGTQPIIILPGILSLLVLANEGDWQNSECSEMTVVSLGSSVGSLSEWQPCDAKTLLLQGHDTRVSKGMRPSHAYYAWPVKEDTRVIRKK